MEKVGGVLVAKFRSYPDLQQGLVPYMTEDILYVLRVVILPHDRFQLCTKRGRHPVAIVVDDSIIHVKNLNGDYALFEPAFKDNQYYPRVDLIVTNEPASVLTQFDFTACTNSYDMTTQQLFIGYPHLTFQRVTEMNGTLRNHLVQKYVLELMEHFRYSTSFGYCKTF